MPTEPWEVIRAAADLLAERAGRFGISESGQVAQPLAEAWIAAMPPAVAEPLVAWLRHAEAAYLFASRREALETGITACDFAALDFARKITGEAPCP